MPTPRTALASSTLRCVKEGLEQPAMAIVTVEEKFRMPLDAEQEPLGGGFNGFDDAIRCPCTGLERWGDILDRLMMGAVDAHGPDLDDPMQEAFRSDLHRMTEPRRRGRLAGLKLMR